jgi:hypothetical protein
MELKEKCKKKIAQSKADYFAQHKPFSDWFRFSGLARILALESNLTFLSKRSIQQKKTLIYRTPNSFGFCNWTFAPPLPLSPSMPLHMSDIIIYLIDLVIKAFHSWFSPTNFLLVAFFIHY